VPFEPPIFPAVADLDVVYRMIMECCDRHFPLVEYRRLAQPTDAEIDEVHDEVPEYRKRWEPAVRLRAYCLPSEESHPMTVFGIEELRDVVLFAAVPCLIETGLAVQDPASRQVRLTAGVGDRFTYTRDVQYDVLEWRIGRTFANTDIPTEFQAIAERVRLQATELG